MVPMLTCGLVRSNFAFATGVSSLRSFPRRGGARRSRALLIPSLFCYSPRALAMISLAMLGGTSAYESNCML
jgi:hypothetical protein